MPESTYRPCDAAAHPSRGATVRGVANTVAVTAVQAREEGNDYELMRRRVADELLRRAERMVDQRVDEVQVRLLGADDF